MPSPLKTEISVAEARSRVLGGLEPLPAQTVPLLEARERVLAEDLAAPRDVPPWNNSAMDGFAVRAAEVREGARFEVIEDLPAGAMARRAVGASQAIRVMTGAPLPDGADCVLPVELAVEESRISIRVREGSLPMKLPGQGDHVRLAGEDVRKGETVLRRGEVLTAAAVGVAASLGRADLSVHRRPRVALLSTGDELVEVGRPVGPGQIYASTLYALAASLLRVGAEPVVLGIARDTREELRERLAQGLAEGDVLLTTGGVSVGEKDFVKEVLDSLGGRMDFWRVEQRPGYPLAFGTLQGKPVFGLPGNPVSTMVSFEQYVQPALLKLSGRTRIFPPVVEAVLEEDLAVKPGKTWFLRGILRREGVGFRVKTTGGQGSGMLTSLSRGNSLIVIAPPRSGGRVGDTVPVQVIDPGFWWSESPGL